MATPGISQAGRYPVVGGDRVYAYVRAGADELDLDSQRSGIVQYAKRHGLQPVQFVQGVIPQFSAGDTLIVSELSRLGRSVVDVLNTLKVLAEQGVNAHVVKSGFQWDASINSKTLTTVLSLVTEIERELRRLRTKEGQARARASGKHIGRPKGSGGHSKLDKHGEQIRELAAKGVTKLHLARQFDCDWATMHKWLLRHGVMIEKAVPRRHEARRGSELRW